MTVHRCELPVPDLLYDRFTCPECGAWYVLVWGPRHGFLWLKRDLVWRPVP